MSTPRPEAFGIYVHWPFCAQKCPYCDFNSHVRHSGWDEARFLAAYERELDHVAELMRASSPPPSRRRRGSATTWGRPGGGEFRTPALGTPPTPTPSPQGGGEKTVSSIFFGGGTPSLMKPATVGAILDRIATLWHVEPDAEITLEANPGSVEAARFAGFRAAGVNRASVGVQSLRDDELKALGRIHTADEAKAAVATAARTFDRFSFDLIYARPRQTPDAWRAELGEALAFAGRHLSLYQLTIEPETRYADLYAKGKLVIPEGEAAHALYETTQDLMDAAGLAAYEISNHAAAGEESRHNLLYWRYGEYAGVGPGAHGRLVVDGRRVATVAERNPEAWAARVEEAGHGLTEMTPLAPSEAADEALLMGMRLSEGLDLDRLAAVGGLRPSDRVLRDLAGQGLIEYVSQPATPAPAAEPFPDEIRACLGPGLAPRHPASRRIRATRQGRFVLNEIVLRLSASLASPLA